MLGFTCVLIVGSHTATHSANVVVLGSTVGARVHLVDDPGPSGFGRLPRGEAPVPLLATSTGGGAAGVDDHVPVDGLLSVLGRVGALADVPLHGDVSGRRAGAEPFEEGGDGDHDSSTESSGRDLATSGRFVGGGPAHAKQLSHLLHGQGDP